MCIMAYFCHFWSSYSYFKLYLQPQINVLRCGLHFNLLVILMNILLYVGLMWDWDARHNDIAIIMVMILVFVSLIVENELNLGIHAFICLFDERKRHSSNKINIFSVDWGTIPNYDHISLTLDRPAVVVWQRQGCQTLNLNFKGWSRVTIFTEY
jgi:hypothetical protein